MVEVRVDLEKCEGCGTCVDVCPVSVFELSGEKAVVVDNDACLACGACEAQCPNNAIEIIE